MRARGGRAALLAACALALLLCARAAGRRTLISHSMLHSIDARTMRWFNLSHPDDDPGPPGAPGQPRAPNQPRAPDMMRFEHAEQPGWRAMRRSGDTHALHALINTHIDGLRALELPAAAGACASVTVCAPNARCVLRFAKEPAGASRPPSVDLSEGRWDLWTCGGALVWRLVRSDEGAQYFVQRGAAAPAGTSAVQAHSPAALERVGAGAAAELLGLARAARGDADFAWAAHANHSGYFTETDVLVRVCDGVRRVLFVGGHSLHHLHAFEAPRCVNACYTAGVVGLVRASCHTRTINARDVRGPCGSEFYISSALGVLHIFPCQQGARRVTCKAFACVAEASFALDMACDDLGIRRLAPLLMHMIIMKGTTGCALDIAHGGNLAHVLALRFGGGVAYVPRLDEVNVHGTCTWARLWDVCAPAACPAALRAQAEPLRALLQRTRLDVRVTRLGTCIYSVAVHKAPAPGAEPDAADVEQCVFALCAYVHAVIGGDPPS